MGTFWLLVSVGLFVAGVAVLWWSLLLGLATLVYAIYLYRGGRYGFFFIVF